MTEKYTNELGQWIVDYAKGQLKVLVRKRRKYTTGALYNSLYYRPFKRGTNINIKLGSGVDYGQYVHYGRKPGKQPPVSSIEEWMKKKPVRLRNRQGSFVKETPKLRRQVAFLIARKIGRDGIEPYPYFTQAVEASFEKREAVEIWQNLAKEQVRFYFER